jgi:maltooligosyltrehalose trehalohydrolase
VPVPSPFPPFGAFPDATGTRFRVLAPGRGHVEVLLESGARAGGEAPLAAAADGWFGAHIPGVRAGDLYRYRIDGEGPFPDPASRFQPAGVHGPSRVVDAKFPWKVHGWHGVPLAEFVIYELHVGTFTARGTFAAATERLGDLRALGVTAVELMPVHDFPGDRNWGYDPAALFAPARCYGEPDDLRAFVDAAHRHGLAVLLDVVYNHLGPDGAYVAAFHRGYLTRRHRSPWGAGVDLDGEAGAVVREFLVQNALMWLTEYRMDGLRLDATHALKDGGERHLLAELAARARAATTGREVALLAEHGRNERVVLAAAGDGGHALDAEWSFDFHHQVHRLLTGERAAYYVDFRASLRDLATILRRGWLYVGQPSRFLGGEPRGEAPPRVHPSRFVFYLQSHDEIGNRPHGERLHVLAGLPACRAALALLLAAPQTPMLFMGEEWAAGSPFLFFTDHRPDLGRRIAESRHRWLERWDLLAPGPAMPDPQDPQTRRACVLDWDERRREPHASMLRFVTAMISLRRESQSLLAAEGAAHEVMLLGRRALAVVRTAPGAPPVAVVASLRGRGPVAADGLPAGRDWQVVLTTEDPAFDPDPVPIGVDRSGGGLTLVFDRPGAVVLRAPA